jgi:hypothetical protein
MRLGRIILVALFAVVMPGCTWPEAFFSVFSSSYSGGGDAYYEKQADFYQRLEDAEQAAALQRY